MNTNPRLVDRKVPTGARRPSLTLKWNPSEASRKVLRAVDRCRGREYERYPDTYKQDIRAPWPQPSPWSPDRLPPTVLHVPPREVYDFLTVIASRATRTLWTGSPASLAFALGNPGLEPVTDDDHLGRQMYFQAHVVTPLVEVDYDLGDGVAPGAVPRFREALRALDRPEWGHFAPLPLIASSIQF